MLEILFAFLIGIISGVLAGLIPGIHPNLISSIIVIYTASLTTIFSPLSLAIFIITLAITNTFVNFIPSIYLGAPDDDNFLSTLPGHQMLKKGKAHEAAVLTLYGSLIALVIILIFIPIFIYVLPTVFQKTKIILPFILIFISLYIIFRESKILLGITIFLLSGFLGFAALNLPVKEPLLPLLTGLFGTSSLIVSLKDKVKIPKQKISKLKEIKVEKKDILKAASASIISAPLCSFLPGIGAGHAAVIGSETIEQSQKGFLILLGIINTAVEGLSFITLFAISRARSGASVAIKEILKSLTIQNLIIVAATIIIAGVLASIITLYLSKLSAKYISKIKYNKLSIITIAIISIATLLISNPLGFLVLITATSLGIFAILSNSRRINLMGCLLIPTILFYLF